MVKLTEYADYECPYCANTVSVVKKLKAEFGARLVFEFKNFPLVEMHPHALIAAEAAEVARREGKFDEMHDALFANQEQLSEETIRKIAASIGLDPERFEREWKSRSTLLLIHEDMEEGIEHGIEGTPTFFINNKMVMGQWSYEILRDKIEHALKIAPTHTQP